MTNVQVAVGLGREAGHDLATSELQVLLQPLGAVGNAHDAAVREVDGGVHHVVLLGLGQEGKGVLGLGGFSRGGLLLLLNGLLVTLGLQGEVGQGNEQDM